MRQVLVVAAAFLLAGAASVGAQSVGTAPTDEEVTRVSADGGPPTRTPV